MLPKTSEKGKIDSRPVCTEYGAEFCTDISTAGEDINPICCRHLCGRLPVEVSLGSAFDIDVGKGWSRVECRGAAGDQWLCSFSGRFLGLIMLLIPHVTCVGRFVVSSQPCGRSLKGVWMRSLVSVAFPGMSDGVSGLNPTPLTFRSASTETRCVMNHWPWPR